MSWLIDLREFNKGIKERLKYNKPTKFIRQK